MIIIWDNGEEYGSHVTFFVEYDPKEVSLADATELLAMRNPNGCVLGIAENITWVEGRCDVPLFDMVSPSLAEAPTPDVPRALILKVADYEEARLRKLLENAKKTKPDDVRWHNNIDRNIAAMVALRFNLGATH